MTCPTEIAISDRREAELAKNGFMPLLHRKNSDFAAFIAAQSLQKPAVYDDPDATANANLSARLPYLFASCRFAHYLKCIVRDKIGSFKSRDDGDLAAGWIATVHRYRQRPGIRRAGRWQPPRSGGDRGSRLLSAKFFLGHTSSKASPSPLASSPSCPPRRRPRAARGHLGGDGDRRRRVECHKSPFRGTQRKKGDSHMAVDAFLKLDSIKGESADVAHKGEIEVLS
jgi:hypothetical protein